MAAASAPHASLLATARTLQANMQQLQRQILSYPSGKDRFGDVLAAMTSLEQALAAGLDVSTRPCSYKLVTGKMLRNQRQHLKRQRDAAMEKVSRLMATKVSGRIQYLWFLRVGLANPSVPAMSLQQFCTDFP